MVYTFTANGAIGQLAVVKITGELTVAPATAGTDLIVGTAIQSVKDGENVPIQILGEVFHGYASGAITAGDKLVPTTDGDVIKNTTSATPYNFIAITTAADGEEVQMLAISGTVA